MQSCTIWQYPVLDYIIHTHTHTYTCTNGDSVIYIMAFPLECIICKYFVSDIAMEYTVTGVVGGDYEIVVGCVYFHYFDNTDCSD